MDDAVEYTKCMDKDKKLRSENGKINQIRKRYLLQRWVFRPDLEATKRKGQRIPDKETGKCLVGCMAQRKGQNKQMEGSELSDVSSSDRYGSTVRQSYNQCELKLAASETHREEVQHIPQFKRWNTERLFSLIVAK